MAYGDPSGYGQSGSEGGQGPSQGPGYGPPPAQGPSPGYGPSPGKGLPPQGPQGQGYGPPQGFGPSPGFGAPQGYGPPTGTGTMPSSVNISSILLFISGGFTLLGGLLLLVAASLGAFFGILAVVYLALGGFEVYLGLQLRHLIPWARTGAILLSAGSILLSLLLISRGSGTTVLGMILPAVVIYLMFRPDTLAVFPRSTKPLGI